MAEAWGNAVEGVEWERVPGAAQLVEIDRLPGRADMFSQVPEEPSAAGTSFFPPAPGAPMFSYEARYSPEPPGPDGWLPELGSSWALVRRPGDRPPCSPRREPVHRRAGRRPTHTGADLQVPDSQSHHVIDPPTLLSDSPGRGRD